MDVLAADIGGTHTRLARVAVQEDGQRIRRLEVCPSHDYGSLQDVVKLFLDEDGGSFRSACFGVAGPVRSGRARGTNLPWTVDAEDLSHALGFPCVVVNDLVAAAWSIPVLPPESVAVLQPGHPDPNGNGAIIAPEIVDFLSQGAFLEAFTAKGRMGRLMQDIPVRVILDQTAPLLGAGRCALRSDAAG